MVFFILTRSGFDEIKGLVGHVPSPVWINKDILTQSEINTLRSAQIEVTNFVHKINPYDGQAIAEAKNIIQDHHEGHHIWVEYAAPSNSLFDACTPSKRRST